MGVMKMGLFSSREYKTLSHAVRAGDLRAARKMLAQGANPNKCDPNDDAYPIHYALEYGPAMVQLLIDHGADVNIPARGFMPLAVAEAGGGNKKVALILRKAGARVRTGNEDYSMDPRLRLQMESKIAYLIFNAHRFFPDESPDILANLVEGKLNLIFAKNMPSLEQTRIREEVRSLIRKECELKYGPIPKKEAES